MQQVTVRAMDLNNSEACADCAPCRHGEGCDRVGNARLVECAGRRIVFAEWDCAGSNRRPAPFLGRLQPSAAMEWRNTTRFAARMRELDCRDSAHAMDETRDPGQRFDV